ncbi:MAG: helix-turn-helix transcriptional regulator [Ruminococcaceae bacterium]|nr:helix-turn-helix transcriptional regulator [Oscillospiraceae bacterium]
MTHAYDEVHLDDAMETLGGAVEYAVLFCDISGQEFLDLFLVSGVADEFARGNVKFISGMSGIELAGYILEKCGKKASDITEMPYIDYPPEYWIGWILAYYQWYTGKTFASICKRISYENLCNLYGALHEADPSKAVEVFNGIVQKDIETNLARLRKERGLSQSQLAKAADISVRSVQLYEQRRSDINKAQYNHLQAMAKVLGCVPDALLEQ